MKKLFILLITLSSVFFNSCQSDDGTDINSKNQEKTQLSKFNPTVVLPTSSLQYDYSSHSKLSKTISNTITSDQIIVTYPQYTYIGSLLNATTIDDATYSPVPFQLKPIDISFSFPTDFIQSTIARPSLSAMRAAVNKATRDANFSGQQSLSFEYDIKQFSKYEEAKLAFGANVNVGSLFKLEASGSSHSIKKKTGVFAKFIHRNFTIDMDLPYDGNVFLNPLDKQNSSSHNPVYISSITYGRLGVLALESNYSYDEVLFALKAAFTAKVVNGELSIDIQSKKVLEESELKTYVLGGKGTDATQIVNGYKGFSDFIVNGGEFTADVPGVPIYFSASHASDNSIFFTKFSVE